MTAEPRVTRTTLDAGQGVALELVAVDGAVDGPTVAVFGAVHGDELEGVAASRAVARNVATALVAGRVLLVPVANPLAFATRTRTTPSDGANLARSFPGTRRGHRHRADRRRPHAPGHRRVRPADRPPLGRRRLLDAALRRVRRRRRRGVPAVGRRGDRVRCPARLGARRDEPGTQPVGRSRSRHPRDLRRGQRRRRSRPRRGHHLRRRGPRRARRLRHPRPPGAATIDQPVGDRRRRRRGRLGRHVDGRMVRHRRERRGRGRRRRPDRRDHRCRRHRRRAHRRAAAGDGDDAAPPRPGGRRRWHRHVRAGRHGPVRAAGRRPDQ